MNITGLKKEVGNCTMKQYCLEISLRCFKEGNSHSLKRRSERYDYLRHSTQTSVEWWDGQITRFDLRSSYFFLLLQFAKGRVDQSLKMLIVLF